jgi:hypothetical protein
MLSYTLYALKSKKSFFKTLENLSNNSIHKSEWLTQNLLIYFPVIFNLLSATHFYEPNY